MSSVDLSTLAALSASARGALVMLAVKSTLVLGGSAVVTLFMQRRSAAARHLVWSIALGSALMLPVLSLIVPAWKLAFASRRALEGLGMAPAPSAAPAVAVTPIAAPVPASAIAVALRNGHRDEASSPDPVVARALALASGTPAAAAPVIVGGSAPIARLTESSTERWAASPRWRERLAPFTMGELAIVLLWPVGALLLLVRAAAGVAAVSRIANRATLVESDPALRHELGDALLRCTARDTELRMSDEVDVAVTWGLAHPVVLLPCEAVEWTRERRRLVLEHELAHVVRRDVWMHLLARVTRSLYWPNPLAWLAERELRLESEQACDDAVIARGVRPTRYAEELLQLVRGLAPAAVPSLAPGFASRPRIERRLRALLDARMPRRMLSRRDAGAAVLGALALAFPLAAMRPVSRELPESGQEPERSVVVSTAPALAPIRAAAAARAVSSGIAIAVTATAASSATSTSSATLASTAMVALPRGGAGGGRGAGYGFAIASGAIAGGSGGLATAAPDIRSAVIASASSGNGSAAPVVAGGQEPQTCVADGHSSSNMTNDDGGVRRWEVHWTGRDCGVDLRAQGKIEFTDDLTDVRSISSCGWFDLSARDGDHLTRLYIKPASDGTLEHRLTMDGSDRPWNAEARDWLGTFLVELDRRTAFAVDTRLPQLLARGGVNAVLDEVGRMTGDYAQGVYLHKLLAAEKLDAGQVRQVIDLAGISIQSDYTIAGVLVGVANRYGLPDAATRAAFLRALDTIESDYERNRTLHALLDRSQPTEAEAGAILASASKLKSDYELARTLVDLVARKLVTPNLYDRYLEDAARLQSDYERSRALRALLGAGTLNEAQIARVITAAAGIQSDNEKANVLVAVAGAYELKGETLNKYEQAVRSIGSTYEQTRALVAAKRSSSQ